MNQSSVQTECEQEGRPRATVSVVVPTYRRPTDLMRCLEALSRQTRMPDEVIVVVREGDTETTVALEGAASGRTGRQRTAMVDRPGQVAALNAGVDAATGDIIAITDDDASPRADWVERIAAAFDSDGTIGAVGGRDHIFEHGDWLEGEKRVVGRLQWFGRVIGDHEFGAGDARSVDCLKGVNMSFRRRALDGIRFDERLRGSGAQVHNDLGICLAIGRAGWKLLYDPGIVVEHYPAERFDEDGRIRVNVTALENAVFNETLLLGEHLPPVRRLAFAVWSIVVGTRSSFGFVQWLRFVTKDAGESNRKLGAALRGRQKAWAQLVRTRAAGARGGELQYDGARAGKSASSPEAAGAATQGNLL